MHAPETEVKTEWIKTPTNVRLSFVGRDAICFGVGSHLVFYSVTSGQQHIFSASERNFDGIQCYAGHRLLPTWAFAEKKLEPRIIILTYPDFHHLKTLDEGAADGYSTLSFTDHDYLISLSNIPRFEIIVWNWRTQEKMASQLSGIYNTDQYLCPSLTLPLSIAQYHPKATKLLIWDVHFAYKTCILNTHWVDMPFGDVISSVTWNTDGALFILNEVGCIYMLNTDQYQVSIIIYGPNTGTEIPCFAWYRGGFVIMEPDLYIKHFVLRHVPTPQGTEEQWLEDWAVESTQVRKLLVSSNKHSLIGWTSEGELLEFDSANLCFNVKKTYKNNIIDISFVFPNINNYLTYSTDNDIRVWDAPTGEEVALFKINYNICVLQPNPAYPYIAVGLENGCLELISFFNVLEPVILATFNLLRYEITKVAFNGSGQVFVAANLRYGLFFIIKGIPGTTMTIINYLDYRRRTIDICIDDDEKHYKLYILTQLEDSNISGGNKIVLKMINKFKEKVNKQKFELKRIMSKISIIDKKFYAQVYNSKKFVQLELKKKLATVKEEISSGHYFNHFHFIHDKFHFYTYGFDGLVIVRNLDFKLKGVLLTHHRMDGGIRKAIVDPHFRFAISLGNDGSLIYMKFVNNKSNPNVIKQLIGQRLHEYAFYFRMTTYGFKPTGEDEGKTYLEMKLKEIVGQEELECAQERKEIMEQFEQLKVEVIQLLDANLKGPHLEKIDILDFYLHTKLRKYKEEMADKECEWTVRYCKELIIAQDQLWNLMKSKYWDTMIVQRVIIRHIYSNVGVENYVTLPEDPDLIYELNYALMEREFEQMLRENNEFKPWIPMTEEQVETILNLTPTLTIKDENTRILEVLEESNSELRDGDSTVLQNEPHNYPTNSASYFMETCKYLYEQEEVHTYTQMNFQKLFMLNDVLILRMNFNEKFNDMMQVKIREMNSIIEKNNRLRYILSELNCTSITIEDPQWIPVEYPESIIKVTDKEVGITPYISPSEQARLDWLAAEAERIRLLLLADDFKERALMKMMDGVLEVRWEDTLKRDIPQPACMIEKEPETFNEEDLRAIKDYEEKVIFLNSERQRYKNMLEQEYAKLSESIREQVRRFNIKIRDLLLLKVKYEAARCQQAVLVQRMQLRIKKRIEQMAIEQQIKDSIVKNEEEIAWVQQKLNELIDSLADCRNAAEVLALKERALEKSYKKEMSDNSPLVQEQSLKLYKKHPKAGIRVYNVALLYELGNSVVTQERTIMLTNECLDYLKSVDNLDQYVGVPNTIDEHTTYKVICKHRRYKLEHEIKLRAAHLEITEIEHSIQAFQKLLQLKRDKAVQLLEDLDKIREEMLLQLHNKQLQIVICQGLVEVPMRGILRDFDNAIMVNRKDVEDINSVIQRVGKLKLKVMNEKMLHRRNILMKEWEHKRMKMEIEDLKEFLIIIEKVKVTKEILMYLKQKEKGEAFDKGMLTLDQEIELTKQSYEKIIAEKQSHVNELDHQIKEFKHRNKGLDTQIAEINIDVCEKRIARNFEFERKEKMLVNKRMAQIVKRSHLVKQIQEQHNEILVLQTELELLRLKTYPTLKFKQLV